MNWKLNILLITALISQFINNAYAQSITLTDFINLQTCSFEKAKGFFEYKGFIWQSSEKNKPTVRFGDYEFYTDVIKWEKGHEFIQYLLIPSGGIIITYQTNQSAFIKLKEEFKKKAISTNSNFYDNRLSTLFFMANDHEGHFNEKKGTYGELIYEVLFFNSIHRDTHINTLCTLCKGKGSIKEFSSCSSCNGHGRKKCRDCSGKGNTYCTNCTEGLVTCNSCWGSATKSCTNCYGSGKKNCTNCYGTGSKTCTDCYGTGSFTRNYGISVTHECGKCKGQGKTTCSYCQGIGNTTCTTCAGKGQKTCINCTSGKVTCPKCNKKYATPCATCQASGLSTEICSYCSGAGKSNYEVTKTCNACNGSKMKKQ